MKISIVIPTLDGSHNLPDFLLSNEIILSNIQGRSKARNIGALKCSNEFILFIDSDSYFSEDTYKDHILRSFIDYPNDVICYESCPCCSRVMGIKKRIFMDMKGFDEAFITGEDREFGFRLLYEGYKIRYIPKKLVTHIDHPVKMHFNDLQSCKNNMRFMLKYKILFLANRKPWKRYMVRTTPLNFFKSMTYATLGGLWIIRSFVTSILAFYYYFFFNKNKLMKFKD